MGRLQSQPATQYRSCPKCGHTISDPYTTDCPMCGIVFERYQRQVVRQQNEARARKNATEAAEKAAAQKEVEDLRAENERLKAIQANTITNKTTDQVVREGINAYLGWQARMFGYAVLGAAGLLFVMWLLAR